MATDSATATDAPLIVGIDAGTSRVRALVFSTAGELISQGNATPPAQHPLPDWTEYEADALWAATVAALRQALTSLDKPQRIVGIGVASIGESGVPLDAHGQPTYPVIAWFDHRSERQSLELETNIGSDSLFNTTGLTPDPMFSLCKLLWLKENEPDAFARTKRWLNIADYLSWRLCNEMATDFSLASRTLALDIGSRSWSDTLIQEVGLPSDLFAPLSASGTPLGPVSRAAAAETGLPERCTVAVGGHDHILGAMAAGAWQPGTLLDSLGTAEAILMTLPQPLRDADLLVRGYSQGAMQVDRPLNYIVGAITTSGACIEWFRKLFANEIPHEQLINEGRQVPAGSNGVGFLPHMRTTSPPFGRTVARGAFHGLTPENHRADLYRAVLEGLAYDAANIVEDMNQTQGIPFIDHIRAIGGNSLNPLLMQIKADAFQRTVTAVNLTEATSLGAALLGGLAADAYDTLDNALSELHLNNTDYDPATQNRGAYRAGIERFRRLPAAMDAIQNND